MLEISNIEIGEVATTAPRPSIVQLAVPRMLSLAASNPLTRVQLWPVPMLF
jgi:hypothetical protein